jgi:hypothetical protein
MKLYKTYRTFQPNRLSHLDQGMPQLGNLRSWSSPASQSDIPIRTSHGGTTTDLSSRTEESQFQMEVSR